MAHPGVETVVGGGGTGIAAPPLPNDGLEQVTANLAALMDADEDYDDGFLKPTSAAYTGALELIGQAARLLEEKFPTGSAAPDGGGGLRVTWEQGDRDVRLVCPADYPRGSYIYHESPADHDVDRNVSGSALAEWLEWLIHEDPVRA